MSVTEFSIDRAKWGQRALLNADGTMCCLGHLSVACGIDVNRLKGKGYPRNWIELPDKFRGEPDLGAAINRAVRINDGALPLREKERELIALFAEHGITLTFYGEAK